MSAQAVPRFLYDTVPAHIRYSPFSALIVCALWFLSINLQRLVRFDWHTMHPNGQESILYQNQNNHHEKHFSSPRRPVPRNRAAHGLGTVLRGGPQQVPRLCTRDPHGQLAAPAAESDRHKRRGGHAPRPREQRGNDVFPARVQPGGRLVRIGIAHLLYVHPRAQLFPQPRRQKGGKLLSLPLRVAAHQRQLG